MRGAFIAVGIAVALGATAGLAYFVMQARSEETRDAPTQAKAAQAEPDRPPREPFALKIRPYESDRTLIEDLRDALAGDPARVNAECWRVSERVKRDAVTMLDVVQRNEASPRVRALVVVAAGVHAQDDPALMTALDDPDPRVRRATVLAIGYLSGGKTAEVLGVKVPVGRKLEAGTRAQLQRRLSGEPDDAVKAAIRAALG